MKTNPLLLFLSFAAISSSLGCGDECSDAQPIPESTLLYPGKIYPLKNWVWDDGGTAISGSVGSEWPADSPVFGHPASLNSGRYVYDFQTNFDDYLDLATGIYYQSYWSNGKPPENHTLLPPDQGGDVEKYLDAVHGHLFNNYAFLDWQKPRCAACTHNAYLSRFFTEQINRFEFTDEYLIPSERLYFGGRLHHSNIFMQDGGCGHSACIDFTIKIGATINLDEDYPESASHFGLEVSSWLYIRELDLETGMLHLQYDVFAPTDPSYLKKISEVRKTVCSLYDSPIDDGEPWMYTKIAIIKEACDYLQYVIDRKAAPGP